MEPILLFWTLHNPDVQQFSSVMFELFTKVESGLQTIKFDSSNISTFSTKYKNVFFSLVIRIMLMKSPQ